MLYSAVDPQLHRGTLGENVLACPVTALGLDKCLPLSGDNWVVGRKQKSNFSLLQLISDGPWLYCMQSLQT